MAQHGMTEKEVRDPSVEIFGSVEQAVQVQANMEAQNLAALQEMLPGGYESCPIFIGLGKLSFVWCFRHQRKPREGEEVMYAPLNADVAIRVWGEGWELYNAYSFDFVDGQEEEVLSIEQYMQRASAGDLDNLVRVPIYDPNNLKYDKQWETYLKVTEGTVLRIKLPNHVDSYFQIPTRVRGGKTLHLQSS
ncbi:hypothetical protein BDZ97DRAFT_1751965 [Flammula alnicola]|nr:hypothetical protein BDZ97DRAFT_1751965 [Flammula alnicola]